MKITFNSLGQIVGGVDYEGQTIRQGTTEVVLKAVFQSRQNINYSAKFNLTRSDGTNITNVAMNLGTDSNSYIFALNDEWYFAKSGQTTLTVFLVDGNGTQIATGQVQFTVQANDYDDDPETISEAQYNALLGQIGSKASISQVTMGFSSMPSSTEIQALSVGQIFNVINGEKKLYKITEVNGIKVADEVFDYSKFPDFTKQEIQALVNAKVDKISADGKVYATDINGETTGIDYSYSNDNNSIPYRNNYGNIKVGEARDNNDAINKATAKTMINELASFKITKNASGDNFATFSELENATTFYSGGEQRIPTRNDIAYVLADENHENATTKYSWQGGIYPIGQWEFDVVVNESPLTDAQINALNSGITNAKRLNYDNYEQTKQNKVYYNARPTNPQDGDIVVHETTENNQSLAAGEGIEFVNVNGVKYIKAKKLCRHTTTYFYNNEDYYKIEFVFLNYVETSYTTDMKPLLGKSFISPIVHLVDGNDNFVVATFVSAHQVQGRQFCNISVQLLDGTNVSLSFANCQLDLTTDSVETL